jgi:hypothetical protein
MSEKDDQSHYKKNRLKVYPEYVRWPSGQSTEYDKKRAGNVVPPQKKPEINHRL